MYSVDLVTLVWCICVYFVVLLNCWLICVISYSVHTTLLFCYCLHCVGGLLNRPGRFLVQMTWDVSNPGFSFIAFSLCVFCSFLQLFFLFLFFYYSWLQFSSVLLVLVKWLGRKVHTVQCGVFTLSLTRSYRCFVACNIFAVTLWCC